MKRLTALLGLMWFVGSGVAQPIPTGSLITINNGSVPTPGQIPGLVVGIGNVSFDEKEPIEIILRPDQTASAIVHIKSIDPDKPNATPQFYLNLTRAFDSQPCRGSVVTLPAAVGLQQNVGRTIPIEITGCSGGRAFGTLGILGSSGDKKEIPVVLRRASSGWLTIALYGSLGLALSMAFLCAVIVARHGHKMADAIGGASWEFSSSWASNLTAFGVAFSFLIQATVFPDKPITGTRTEYFFLATFAGALVALAPTVQRLLGKTDIDDSSGIPVSTTHGMVGGFLGASFFTMWGAYLQIVLAILVARELGMTATLSEPVANLVGLVVSMVGVALAFYCWWTMLTTIAANASRTGTATGKLKTFAAAAVKQATAVAGKISVL